MTHAVSGMVAVAVGLVLATGAFAQQTPAGTQSGAQSTQSAAQSGVLLDSSAIVGSTVRAQGKDMGKVSRLMVDPKDGKIQQVIVSMGGTMGVGEKTVALPWNAVKLAQDGQKLVVDVEQRILDQAPRADTDRRDAPAASPSTPPRQR